MSNFTKNTTLGAFAAGLMAATALVGAVSVLPATQAVAQNQLQAAAIDPSKGFADLVDRVMPAVVSVQVKYATVAATGEDQAQGGRQMPNGMEDFFKQFPQFRNMPGMGQGDQGDEDSHPNGGMAMGSGFIISADGYAVTNNHVVKDADQVSVTMKDGAEYKAEVIGTDAKTDLALIKIDAKDKKFDYVSFTKDEPRVGDWVMAVGNPFGLGGTVTTGIVSALGRDIGSGPYDNFMQIDAAINRGNSGGPAFNLEGEVVGINTAIFSPSGGSVGIGFAIPASTAQNVIESLKENGKVTRGWLGVQIQPVTEDIAESLGLKDAKGAIVADVTEDSPALAAGVKQGDTILKIDGKDVSDSRDLSRKVAGIKPGDSVPLTVVRDGKTIDLDVKIGTMPDDKKMASKDAGKDEGDKSVSLADLGLRVAPAEDGPGVTVTDVAKGSAAAGMGLKAGDTILEVAGQEVHAPSDVRAALKANDKKKVLILVKTGEGQRFIALPTAKG
ncbi:MAG: Do family serine endopeptidase [Aestuariivirga sp.]|uniref:Do family serine endopeptidase n=1 Tax=Aestuariivirga sp. TaxID=2650926 RepID=UPI0025C0E8EA|nr:Do family serine endopeptidase [Aestuariivirga sp.]MCA3561469.1 Do family serine endopeptidase [Aestuariivirga sp.]